MRRPLVNEMKVEAIDFGGELIESVQRGFARSPVVTVGPVSREVTGVGQGYAPTPVIDALRFWPTGERHSRLQIVENVVGDVDAVRPDLGHASHHAGTAHRRVPPGPRRYH